MEAVVKSVTDNSIAFDIGVIPGDIIVSVNGIPIKDILDFRFLTASEQYEIEIKKTTGEVEIVEIINEYYEEFGVTFENYLIDKEKWCQNKCVFCFIDQLPKNMRKSLYYKDDDYRLSTLMGNYITLTNLKEHDVKRIIDMHLPRINVSVHTVNKDLRAKMLNNKNSDVLSIMKRFYDARIFMDCQVVLCKGINDGEYLDETITELAKLYPYVQSLSVVPVGLTCHREGLCRLEGFNKDDAGRVITQVYNHSKKCLKELGTSFVFASDEFYVKAEHPLPDASFYEDFLQIENGVGLLSSFIEEWNSVDAPEVTTKKTIATGVSAAPYIKELVDGVTDKVNVIAINNDFFGNTITVAGLLTGKDIVEQLKGKDLGEVLILPEVLLNYDGVLLDDYSISDIEHALNIKVITVPNDGAKLKEVIGG
ncbi:MAG: DUF512 domain-containing protein [Clostridia bacterium]|nr:DUF512 domain-containing protein [Clostridia bacterium]